MRRRSNALRFFSSDQPHPRGGKKDPSCCRKKVISTTTVLVQEISQRVLVEVVNLRKLCTNIYQLEENEKTDKAVLLNSRVTA